MPYELPVTVSGRVIHLRDGEEVWGRENFSMTSWAKGRLMSATTEFDDRKVIRHASWTVGADWLPREAMSREVVDGELVASSWFRVDGTAVECEAFTKELGRLSQRLETGRRIDYFGMHTILADVLIAAVRGLDAPGEERAISCITNSVAPWGMGGYHAILVTPLVTYVGPEEIEVRAGPCRAEHFRVRWSDLTPDYANLWVTQGDFLPLRLQGAFGPVSYELETLARS